MPKVSVPTPADNRNVVAMGGLRNAVGFDPASTGVWVTVVRVPWIPSLGIEYHSQRTVSALDLLLLTGIVAIAGISLVEHRAPRKEFFAFY